MRPSEEMAAAIAEWARQDDEERAAVVGLDPPPHYELNDGTCVSCGGVWPCLTSDGLGGFAEASP